MNNSVNYYKYFTTFHWLKASGVNQLWEMRAIIPLIQRYIGLEKRLIDGIFDWKLGCIGNMPLINLISRL